MSGDEFAAAVRGDDGSGSIEAGQMRVPLVTKVSGKMYDGLGGSGLSRKAVLEQACASHRRLGTDY
jgi:aryl-alcohol dehydrogenase-like predicted oxidoreductase